MVNGLTFKGILLLAVISLGLLVGGCSWFAWLPGVGDGGSKDDEESSEPIKLEKFIAEADIRVIWKRGVGQGLGKKYVRLTPSVVADRVVAADAYGGVFAFDRFNGKEIWACDAFKIARRINRQISSFPPQLRICTMSLCSFC